MADARVRLVTEEADLDEPAYARSESEEFGDALLDALDSEDSDEEAQQSRVRLANALR